MEELTRNSRVGIYLGILSLGVFTLYVLLVLLKNPHSTGGLWLVIYPVYATIYYLLGYILGWSLVTIISPNRKQKILAIVGIVSIGMLIIMEMLSITYATNARSKDTSKEQLRYLSNKVWAKFDYSIYRALASNTNTPPTVLKKLSKVEDDQIRNRFATPRELFSMDYRTVQERVAGNPCAPQEVLIELDRKGFGYMVRKNPQAPERILRKYSESKNKLVRREVATNVGTPVEILQKLAKDPFEYVRWGVVVNKSATRKILERLKQDEKLSIRRIAESRLEKMYLNGEIENSQINIFECSE